ncbi:MAG TPA: glutaminyl-peptide cyclotransferase [Flavobacteriaceae bacterium]|nr:glutaminyl-peptide cyclotransferase [Flavobacteriaceae bacterium]
MFPIIKKISLFAVVLFFIGCETDYKFTINAPQKITIDKTLNFAITEENKHPFDSIQVLIDNQRVPVSKNSVSIPVNNYQLGKHSIDVIVFYEEKTTKLTQPIYFLADKAPEIYTYKIINTYPHDVNAYTQGLEFYNGFLYEGTGRNGTSSLRKVELETGKVLKQIDLDDQYFGEGITILNNKIYQLTWRKGVGFVYDLKSFKKITEFSYKRSLEGWGLTNNGEKLIKTDGTERIWFINPETFVEERYIEVYTNTQKVEKLNELEYINGKIYANRWQLNSILIINSDTGMVEAVVNLNSLYNLISKEQTLDNQDEVLNGIAYDSENNRIFVTGKHWGKLYEIELLKK